jgi:hypothetical protein
MSCATCDATFAGAAPHALEPSDLEPPSRCSDVPSSRSAELVIAHCVHPLDWVTGYVRAVHDAGLLRVARVIVYSKCGRVPNLTNINMTCDINVTLRTLPNVGRSECHSNPRAQLDS